MSNTKIVLLSAVLFGTLPAISPAFAADEQAQPVQATEDPAAQDQSVTDPSAADAQSSAAQENLGVTTPGQTPDVQTPAEHKLDEPEQPDPANPYAIKTFFADFKRFSIGSVVPDLYRTKKYEIVDWKTRHLPKPEEGTSWTYMGGNYVLFSKADGKIIQAESGEIFYHQ